MNQFFKDQFDFAPERFDNYSRIDGKLEIKTSWGAFVENESVDNAEAGLSNEFRRFKAYLMDKEPADRTIILEDYLNELIFVWGQIRKAMKGLSNKEKDKGRPSMNHLYETICFVLQTGDNIKIQYSDEFRKSWHKRGIDEFFGELPEPTPKEEKDTNLSTPDAQEPLKEAQKIFITDEALDVFKSYFKAPFKGMGQSEDYFTNYLIPDLKKPRNGKQYATIALLIYESEKLILAKRPKSFASWYKEFCNILDIKECTYKPTHLNTKDFESEFYYLVN